MSDSKRRALRVIPPHDPDNNIGAVDRVRYCIVNNRMQELTASELEQMERWRQIDKWIRERRYSTVNERGKDVEEALHGHAQLRSLVMAYFTLSWDTAERDIANTKKFCVEAYDDQDYYRSVYIQDAERLFEEAARFGKYAAAERLLRLAAELRGHFADIQVEIPDDKIEAFQLNIEYNPEAVGLKTIENKDELFEKWRRRRKSVSDIMKEGATDVESE